MKNVKALLLSVILCGGLDAVARADTAFYSYDPAGRLTAVDHGTWSERFSYDNAGNLLQREVVHPQPDAGTPDRAGTADGAGPTDGSTTTGDTGTPPEDASTQTPDGSTSPQDASAPTPDGSTPPPDAGTPSRDAASARDAGHGSAPDAGAARPDRGCGSCSQGAGASSPGPLAAALVGAALFLVRGLRRRPWKKAE